MTGWAGRSIGLLYICVITVSASSNNTNILFLLSAQLMMTLADYEPCSPVNYLDAFPGNCSKFRSCTTFGYVAMDCPWPLYFSVRTQRCEYRSDVPECQDSSACASNRCVRGNCFLDNTKDLGYSCVCDLGYTGVYCSEEVRGCSSSNCIHGYCNTQNTCTCYTGYSGVTCNVIDSLCSPNPCVNGGTCTTDGFRAYCSCPADFYGGRCETYYPSTNCPMFPCPVDVPEYSYPSWTDLSCRSYYRCVKGALTQGTCPPFQKFDVVSMSCQNQAAPDRFFCDIFRGPTI